MKIDSFDFLRNNQHSAADFRTADHQSRVELLHRAFRLHLQTLEAFPRHLHNSKHNLRACLNLCDSRVAKVHIFARRRSGDFENSAEDLLHEHRKVSGKFRNKKHRQGR